MLSCPGGPSSGGTFPYQPRANTVGSTISVTAVNDAPVADEQSVSTNEDTAKAITLAATDADSDPLSYIIVSGPSHGSLSGGTGANRTYTPLANYNGPDSFSYKASDGILQSGLATVSITVSPVNDPPVVDNPSDRLNYVGDAVTVAIQASDPDDDPLTFSASGLPTGLSINDATGVVSGMPTTVGVYDVTVTASDGELEGSAHFVWRVLVGGGTGGGSVAVPLFHYKAAISCGPVRYADGAISETWVDLSSEAFGSRWAQARSYSPGACYSQGQVNGTGMVNVGMIHLRQMGETVAVVIGGITQKWHKPVQQQLLARLQWCQRPSPTWSPISLFLGLDL